MNKENQTKPDKAPQVNHLRLHFEVVIMLYAVGLWVSFYVLTLSEAQKDIVTLLSTGAILATFGSAIGAVALIWQGELLERIHLNIDILYLDILKHEAPWRRWPFLARSGRANLLDGKSLQMTLSNPEITLDVGSHLIKIDVPSFIGDHFDLQLIKNYWILKKYRYSAQTLLGRRDQSVINSDTGLNPVDEYMAYECMFDIWKSILKFRVSRYILHFASGLTICAAIVATLYVLAR